MNESDRQALLAQLRDVQLPPVSDWPAPGWWLLMASLVVLLAAVLWQLRRRRALLWQRQALAELERIRRASTEQTAARTLAECSTLCRRVLLVVHGREHSAQLHGRAWLLALDAVVGRPVFAAGFGTLLETGPYQRAPQVAQHDLESLFDAIDALIRAGSRPASRAPDAAMAGTASTGERP